MADMSDHVQPDTRDYRNLLGCRFQYTKELLYDGQPKTMTLEGECIGVDPRPLGYPPGVWLVIRPDHHNLANPNYDTVLLEDATCLTPPSEGPDAEST